MAFVNVNPMVLKEVSKDVETYDELITRDYLVRMCTAINNLINNTNGIKSPEIQNTLKLAGDKLGQLTQEITSDLNGLEEDIAAALSEYQVNTELALDKLANLFNIMQGFTTNKTFNFAAIENANYMEAKTEETQSPTTGSEITSDFEGYLSENGELEKFNDITNSDDWEKYFKDYAEYKVDQAAGVGVNLIDDFTQEWIDYSNRVVGPGGYVDVQAFINSPAGEKWAIYLPPEGYTRNYDTVLGSPDSLLTDYINYRIDNPINPANPLAGRGGIFVSDGKGYLNILEDNMVTDLYQSYGVTGDNVTVIHYDGK